MTTRARVYIIQEPPPDRATGEPVRDFTPAEKFGGLKVLLRHDHDPLAGDLVRDLLDAGLQDYQADDYLICSGHPVAIGVAVAIVAQFCPVNLLLWSGRKRDYDLVTVDPLLVGEEAV